MKKYKFIYYEFEEDYYIFANKRPNDMNEYFTRRYHPKNLFYEVMPNTENRGVKSWTEVDLSGWLAKHLLRKIDHMKSDDRRLKRQIKKGDISRTFADPEFVKRYFDRRKQEMKQIKKQIEFWTKRNEELKNSKEYLMEILMK